MANVQYSSVREAGSAGSTDQQYGSSNDHEVALTKDCQFILTSFPMNERLVFNRTYAGYRGSLTFTEDLYDNL